MKNKPFQKETIYGLLFIILAAISGLLLNQWVLSFLIWALIYILWKWVELYHFYYWYKDGAVNNETPLNHGVWKEFASLIAHNINRNKKIKIKNQHLINQFNTMAQAMPFATVLLNKKFEIVWSNELALPILNILTEKDKNSKITSIIRQPEFVKIIKDDLQQEEIKVSHLNDSYKRIEIKIVKLSNKRYLLVARDISKQDVLRQSRKAFVANASHELRTPLTVITGYLEMMYDNKEIPEQWHIAVNQALSQSARMDKIIDDMLKLSSMEHQQYLEYNDTSIEMPGLLNQLLNDVKNSSKAKDHRFSANIDSSLTIKGNESDITSICLNLLNNAVIHTKVNTNVSLRWFKLDNKPCLEICDDGDGIEEKHLPHLSERFYRVDNSSDKNSNSTGLGLAIVKQICENHGASLAIKSVVGKGTCMKIIFSLAQIRI